MHCFLSPELIDPDVFGVAHATASTSRERALDARDFTTLRTFLCFVALVGVSATGAHWDGFHGR